MAPPLSARHGRIVVVLLAATLAPLCNASAQRPTLAVRPQVVAVPPSWIVPSTRLSLAADSVVIPETYWLEGGIVGGGLLGVATAVFAVGMCGFDSPCSNEVGAALLGAGIGGTLGFAIGALVGGQFPKHRAHAASSPPN